MAAWKDSEVEAGMYSGVSWGLLADISLRTQSLVYMMNLQV